MAPAARWLTLFEVRAVVNVIPSFAFLQLGRKHFAPPEASSRRWSLRKLRLRLRPSSLAVTTLSRRCNSSSNSRLGPALTFWPIGQEPRDQIRRMPLISYRARASCTSTLHHRRSGEEYEWMGEVQPSFASINRGITYARMDSLDCWGGLNKAMILLVTLSWSRM